jgi:hypothetical protein
LKHLSLDEMVALVSPWVNMAGQAAAKIAPQLLLHVAGDVFPALLTHGREEALEVLAHDEMERGPLGSARGVLREDGARCRTTRRGGDGHGRAPERRAGQPTTEANSAGVTLDSPGAAMAEWRSRSSPALTRRRAARASHLRKKFGAAHGLQILEDTGSGECTMLVAPAHPLFEQEST